MEKKISKFGFVVGFAAAVLLLLLAGSQMYRSLHEYMGTSVLIAHTHQVLETLNKTSATMRDLESGQRAYIITHDDSFLAEYQCNKTEIRSLLALIKQLTVDNPQQQSASARLKELAEERLQLLERLVEVYHSQGFEAARSLIKSGLTRLSMENMLHQINAMEDVERNLLTLRYDQAEQNATRALRIALLLVTVALTSLLLLWWLVNREMRKRRAAEQAVHESEQMQKIFELLQGKNVELESARVAAEKANLAKSEFLSSMSHELRSPLNAILGFAQVLESDSPPPTADQSECITEILQSGWHLLKLIDEILDLTKIESGHTPLSREPVSLSEVILECQSMIEPQAQQYGVQLTIPRFDIPYFVSADRIRVKQVIINLLSNAIKYNSSRGTVMVKCTESTPGQTRVSISDTGRGLDEEQLAQLFQAFNRLGQEAGDVEGTGIGLVVAKRLVELMGGRIGVESMVGRGSVFWFELVSVEEPHLVADDIELAAIPPREMFDGAGQHTLLYVEDNPANLKLVRKIIARYPDIQLLTALNGRSGIELARVSRPDVILMDINLPGMSGIEAMKILRDDQTTAHIPVIALSANAMLRDVEKGLQSGFFRYLTKPIKVDELMGALDVALEYAKNRDSQSS